MRVLLLVHSLCLAGSEVAQLDSGAKGQTVHVLCCRGVHFPCLGHSSTLGLRFTGCLRAVQTKVRLHFDLTSHRAVRSGTSRYLKVNWSTSGSAQSSMIIAECAEKQRCRDFVTYLHIGHAHQGEQLLALLGMLGRYSDLVKDHQHEINDAHTHQQSVYPA